MVQNGIVNHTKLLAIKLDIILELSELIRSITYHFRSGQNYLILSTYKINKKIIPSIQKN